MKKIFFVLLTFIPLLSLAADKDIENLWQRATLAYSEGDYKGALSLYDSINVAGYEDAKLYYNIGNAYYKQDSIAKAIVFYMKAGKLDPTDKNIAHNLALAQAMTKNRIDTVPEFFAVEWMRSLRNMMGSNGWAVLAVICFTLSLLSVMLYLLTSKVGYRKIGFSIAVAMLVLFIISLNYSLSQRREKIDSGDAVVIKSAVAVKGSPDVNGKELFILNEGAQLKITDSLGSWREIVIASGNRGWLTEDAIMNVD